MAMRTTRLGSVSTGALALALAAAPAGVWAETVLPTGGQVVAGQATIGLPSGNQLVVDQQSQRAVIDWQSFSIGAGGTVQFNNGSGATLNRISTLAASSVRDLNLRNATGDLTVAGDVTYSGSAAGSIRIVSDAGRLTIGNVRIGIASGASGTASITLGSRNVDGSGSGPLRLTGTSLLSNGGNIAIFGKGLAGDNRTLWGGITLSGVTINATGVATSGSVTVDGRSTDTPVQSVLCDNGQPGCFSLRNAFGVLIADAGTATSIATAGDRNIAISGRGVIGVSINDGNASRALVTAAGGSITLDGTGFGSVESTSGIGANLVSGIGRLTITPKTLQISGVTATGKVFDGTRNANFTGTPTVTTGIGSETITISNGTAQFATPDVVSDEPGTEERAQAVTFTGFTATAGADTLLGNYTILQPVNGSAIISRKNLTISAIPTTKTYGDLDPSLTTDVVINVTDRRPVRAFASFDNSGTPATRRERISSGVTWGNAFGADGQLTLQGTVSPDLFESRGGKSLAFEAYTGSLVQPLSRRDTLIAFASYQRAAPSLGANLGQVGKNLQLTTRWARTISSNPKHRTVLTLGYDYKQTNNNLLFGGTSISSQKTDIHQASLDLSVTRPWSGGLFGVSATVTGSPGGIGSRNSTAAFRPTATRSGTPFAKADYVYLRTTATQVTPLGKSGFEARTRFVGQLSSANLLPSEQLSAAGPGVLRGYDPNAAIGTRGFVASQELWTQPISLVSRAGPMADRLQVGAFIEAGQVGNPDRLVAERKWTKTASVGLSAAWSLGPYATLRADYGWQLKALPGTEKGSLGYLTATIGF